MTLSEDDGTMIADVLAEVPSVKNRGGKKPEEEYMQCGPFQFTSDITYGEFLDAIAKSLPCPSAEYIVASKVTWRPQKPLKVPPLPLGGTVGFSIMVEQTVIKKVDAHVIILMMPAPTKPMEEKFWSTDEIPAAVIDQDFNYEELNTLLSTEEHIQQQKMTFDQALMPKRMQLEEHYPENNNLLYPTKWVYTDIKTGHAWELTMGRLNIWAAHLARGSATLEKPPAAAAFNMNQRIKTTPPTALLPNVLQVAAAPVAPAATATPSITDLFMLHMLQQSQFLTNGQPPASTATGPLLPIQRTTSISATTALLAPSFPSKHH